MGKKVEASSIESGELKKTKGIPESVLEDTIILYTNQPD